MKFTLCIDYKAANKKGLEYMELNATTLEDAISEADDKWNDDIYLMKIMKKVGKTERQNGGWKTEKFEAVLCRRSFGWHLNNRKNSESEHFVRHYIPKIAEYHWFETL